MIVGRLCQMPLTAEEVNQERRMAAVLSAVLSGVFHLLRTHPIPG
jgi:hypothetical protein